LNALVVTTVLEEWAGLEMTGDLAASYAQLYSLEVGQVV
jgi:hypothetical protein